MTNSALATTLMTMVVVCGFATLVWWLSIRLGYRVPQDPPVDSSKWTALAKLLEANRLHLQSLTANLIAVVDGQQSQ
jgi:hypothetical protein